MEKKEIIYNGIQDPIFNIIADGLGENMKYCYVN
jgi:hypothetical protein